LIRYYGRHLTYNEIDKSAKKDVNTNASKNIVLISDLLAVLAFGWHRIPAAEFGEFTRSRLIPNGCHLRKYARSHFLAKKFINHTILYSIIFHNKTYVKMRESFKDYVATCYD